MERISFVDWGIIPYYNAYEKQSRLFLEAVECKKRKTPVNNLLIFCQHPQVITLGKHAQESNLLISEEECRSKGISIIYTDRGGDVTYHGPGQLVIYPIIDLEAWKLTPKTYLSLLEEAIIRLLSLYGIEGERLPAAGIWIGANKKNVRKICAVGLKCRQFITMHGLALNINTKLECFQWINPCGFTDRGVTSMEKELKREIDEDKIKFQLSQIFLDLLA
jgi:lipoate-protein ligase B